MNFLKMGTFHIEWFSYKRTLMLHFIIDGFDLMKEFGKWFQMGPIWSHLKFAIMTQQIIIK